MEKALSSQAKCSEVLTVLGVNSRCIDLSWPLNESTIMWPGGEKFKLCMYCTDEEKAGYHYAAGTFSAAEHGGTHIDAPWHFNKDGKTVDQIPLSQLIAPCCVIDVSRKCVDTVEGRNYLVSVDDITEFEAAHGGLSEGSIVLVRTGWSKYWKYGADAYLGFDEAKEGPHDPSRSVLQFPGIGTEAAQLFAARRVVAVGLDTASVDHGPSTEFATHRIFAAAGIYGIENVSSAIVGLPSKGSTVFVLPLKITGGSGAPSRIVAIVPEGSSTQGGGST